MKRIIAIISIVLLAPCAAYSQTRKFNLISSDVQCLGAGCGYGECKYERKQVFPELSVCGESGRVVDLNSDLGVLDILDLEFRITIDEEELLYVTPDDVTYKGDTLIRDVWSVTIVDNGSVSPFFSRKITITVYLNGVVVSSPTSLMVNVFSDSTGANWGTGGSTGLIENGNGHLLTIVSKKRFAARCDSNGLLVLKFTDNTSEIIYIGVEMPDGTMTISAAIQVV